MADFYEDMSEQTAERLKKCQQYIDLAIKNGDVVYMEKPFELTIKIRIIKEKK